MRCSTQTSRTIKILPYAEGDAAEWDELVASAPMGTFLHTRRFLGYHGDRFVDRSLLVRDDRARLVGVFPAAVDPRDESRVVSHPGITYGGVVHRGGLLGPAMIRALDEIRDRYAAEGLSALRYKVVPSIYHRRPSADDVYALVQLGGRLYRSDLSCAIDLAQRGRRSDRRRRGERKAVELGVEIVSGVEEVEALWSVVHENLAGRHGVRPTHSAEDIRLLLSLFPDSIEVVTAHLDGSVVAGVVLFMFPDVVHTQYIASSAAGRNAAALEPVLEHCIARATSSGVRFFDFGISTEDDGRVLNADLYKFKCEFGGGGVVHEFYELEV